MNGDGEDQSTDTTVIPPEQPAPAPGPTAEQLSDMPSAQLPQPAVRRAEMVQRPPLGPPPAAPGPAPTPEQVSDMPSAQLPPPRGQLGKGPPVSPAQGPEATAEQLSDMPSAQLPPPVPRAYLAPGRANVYSGLATTFATPQDLATYKRIKAAGGSEEEALLKGDNGIGSPALGTVDTAGSYGIAAPTRYLIRHFGNNPAAWRTARAQLTTDDGQTVQVPFVDIGPGGGQLKKGIITDISHPLAQGLGAGGMDHVTLKYIPNAGPDYMADRDAWYQEQSRISSQFKPAAQETPDQGYDQSYQHIGGVGAAINS